MSIELAFFHKIATIHSLSFIADLLWEKEKLEDNVSKPFSTQLPSVLAPFFAMQP